MNSQTTLALVRHGETDWNAQRRIQGSSDNPLNDTGREQVRRTAELLRAEQWDAIVTSPLVRARQSAGILAEELGLPIVDVVPGITERDYGPAEGLQDGDELRSLRIPGGFRGAETERAVVERATAALLKLVAEHPGARVIVVAHGTLIRLSLTELGGSPIESISNAAHCVVHHEPSEDDTASWVISVVNGAAYEAPGIMVSPSGAPVLNRRG